MSKAWLMPGITVGTTDGNLTAALNGVTDQHNTEWYIAMRQFCGAIWGTSDWGKKRKWLAGNPDPSRSTRNLGLEFTDPVGTSWSRGGSAPHDANKVMVTLRPVPGGHSPYVVLTSMPSDLPPPPQFAWSNHA
ncbi:RNase A-like domain-containing protein [Streptomyces sp. NPDC058576]|uniref:RNase A-like domain-containing protein n=1 Tax=Streptomyces sp. NPDC058576 TaxID=3346547 RepID=UPI00365596AB